MAFPYPVPFVYAGGSSAEMVSSPMGIVWYNATGGTTPPFNMSTVGLTIDPDGGLVYFNQPVWVTSGGVMAAIRWPAVVQAFLAVGYGTMTAVAPPTGYAGTLYNLEGVARTKYITVLEWKDYSNQLNMQTFAAEVLDSVKDVVIEARCPISRMPGVVLAGPGERRGSIAGRDFVAGWEDICAIPVVSVDVVFQTGAAGTSYVTTLQLSNRRTPYDAANFLRPNLQGGWIAGRLSEPFGAGLASSQAQSKQLQEQSEKMTAESTRPAGGFTGQVLLGGIDGDQTGAAPPMAAMGGGDEGGASRFIPPSERHARAAPETSPAPRQQAQVEELGGETRPGGRAGPRRRRRTVHSGSSGAAAACRAARAAAAAPAAGPAGRQAGGG